MYLLAKFGGHRSYRNGDINSYMDTLEKAELTTSIRHNARILKSGIPIYNSEVQIQLEEKQQEDEHKQNCKALCVSRKRKKPYELYCNGHGNRVFP